MLGNNVRDIRIQRGMTIQQLSDKSGIKPNVIAEIERGDNKSPTQPTIADLARALSVTEDVLTAKNGTDFTAANPKELIIYFDDEADTNRSGNDNSRHMYVDGDEQYNNIKAYMNNADSYVEVVDVYGAAYCIPKAKIRCVKLHPLNDYEREHIKMTIDKNKR